MGLLSEGSPLSWAETKKHADHVRQHGVLQFINLYNRLKDRANDCLRWGDEVEYMMVKLDHEKKSAKLLLKAESVLEKLQEKEKAGDQDVVTLWRPEYASYMVEGTPGKPYGHRMAHFNMVECNMKQRREDVLNLLTEPGETALSLTAFPRTGCPSFTHPETKVTPNEGASHSLFYPDLVTYQGHPRFKTLTRNIRERRGEKVAINIPIFKDEKTKSPFTEDFHSMGDKEGVSTRQGKPDHIYMDCMGFGMGCSCLQMTFQAQNIDEARFLYDQLTPLCPIMLALSAASPIQRGYLSDVDCRWNVIAASVDDRTREEKGLEPLKNDRFVINKSRYDSIDSYLSPGSEKYNDIYLTYDPQIYQQLKDAGIDHLLAQHIAHLFIRDPISLFSEKIHQNDECDVDHFENIQSTNWQTMRFKPPPPCSPIGWRVEFRPTEVQLTDFENAAYAVFIVLITRVILSFKLNMLIPISKVDENMKKAQRRDAVLNEKFHFRKDILSESSPPLAEQCCSVCKDCDKQYTEMTVNEIINGKEGEFPGFVPLIKEYLNDIDDVDIDTSCTILQYLHFISKRASGELSTTAHWIRSFVRSHPDYKQDSVVSESINYDLIKRCDDVTQGRVIDPTLTIDSDSKTSVGIPQAMTKATELLNERVNQQN